MQVLLRPRAKKDIEQIWAYTASAWNIDQAEHYILALRATLERLGHYPSLGRSCDEIRPGYRKYLCGSHVIFYRLVARGIDVVRILHGRMDFKRSL